MHTKQNTENELGFWAHGPLPIERLRDPFKSQEELAILANWYCKNKKKFDRLDPAALEAAPF